MIEITCLICCLAGHDLTKPEIVDYRHDGLVVVSSYCRRCGRDILGLVSATSLEEDAKRDEGPWGTVPCLFCKCETLLSQSACPELWPCGAICPRCRETWEKL